MLSLRGGMHSLGNLYRNSAPGWVCDSPSGFVAVGLGGYGG